MYRCRSVIEVQGYMGTGVVHVYMITGVVQAYRGIGVVQVYMVTGGEQGYTCIGIVHEYRCNKMVQ
jgi:hypothetical protein